jgi:hypothetical protein
MPTFVERARELISAENDDFFDNDTILFYLNKSQEKVVSYAIKQEEILSIQSIERRSVMALNELRSYTDITITGSASVDNNGYFEAEIVLPTDLAQISSIRYTASNGTRIPLKELSSLDLNQLGRSNIKPTTYEGYYHVTKNVGNSVVLECITHEDADTNNLRIYGIDKPTAISLIATTLTELPSSLENAVVYGAVLMMVMQEGVKDPQTQVASFAQLYQEELQANIY